MYTRNLLGSSRTRALIHSLSLGTALALLAFAMPTLAESSPPAATEGCPGTTSLIATFAFDSGSWTSSSADSVVVSGDSMLSHWWSSTAITGLVITAGSVTHNYVSDPLETAGTIAASDVKDADGGALSKIGFCSGGGSVPNPSSGSKISVGVTKTAECAKSGAGGNLLVSGLITIVRHSPPGDLPSVAIRVRVARDTVYAGATIVSQTSVSGLVGAIMRPSDASLVVPYSVSFATGSSMGFSNQIQVMVEEAATGLDRHKYYNARADFGLCAVPTQSVSPGARSSTPSPTTKVPASHSPEQSVQAGRGTPAGLPNTASGASAGGPWVPLSALAFLASFVALFVLNLGARRA